MISATSTARDCGPRPTQLANVMCTTRSKFTCSQETTVAPRRCLRSTSAMGMFAPGLGAASEARWTRPNSADHESMICGRGILRRSSSTSSSREGWNTRSTRAPTAWRRMSAEIRARHRESKTIGRHFILSGAIARVPTLRQTQRAGRG